MFSDITLEVDKSKLKVKKRVSKFDSIYNTRKVITYDN